MKKCGKCGKQYENTMSFCLDDGSTLSADDSASTDTEITIPQFQPSDRLPKVDRLMAKNERRVFTEDERFERICNEISSQLHRFGIIPATGVARAVLHQERYEYALNLFNYLLKKASSFDTDLYIIYGNIGYCLVGMNYFEEALAYFHHVKKITNCEHYLAWHSVAAAYCYWHLGQKENCKRELAYAKTRLEYHKTLDEFVNLYPEIKDDL